jgi:hypothetical protein
VWEISEGDTTINMIFNLKLGKIARVLGIGTTLTNWDLLNVVLYLI